MARTRGSRNAKYEQQRAALAQELRRAVATEGGIYASTRELAAAAGTSVATLRHYFGDREGMLQAVMEDLRAEAAPYLAMSGHARRGGVRGSLLHFLEGLGTAWRKYGVGQMYGATLALGLGAKALGPGYVTHVLEPLLQTGESLLRQHVERGELRIEDLRHASLLLLSPVVLGLLHQDNLGGAGCRPLSLPRLLEAQVDAFLRAYPPPKQRRR